MKVPASVSAAERALDEAIELTFPASDPISVDHAFRSADRAPEARAHAAAPPPGSRVTKA